MTFCFDARGGDCSLHAPKEWQDFLQIQADQKGWIETCEDSTCDEDFYNHVKDDVKPVFENCADFIAVHEGIHRCTANMRKFIPTWLQQHDGVSYGFTVNNHSYLSEQVAKDKPPGMMTPPAAIIAALPDRNQVETAVRKNGWKYLTHDSALGGTRTFVLIPDAEGRFDQWLLLNLQSGNSTVTAGSPMSVLSVQKKDIQGNTLSAVRLHFRDYTLHRTSSGYAYALNEENNGKCFSCHGNGVRQLISRKTPVLEGQPVRGEKEYVENNSGGVASKAQYPIPVDFAFQRLLEFNRRLRSYGTPNWDGKITPENLGPALGGAQGCMDCHNDQSRGSLTVFTSPNQLKQKIYYELNMPPDLGLSRYLERSEMKNPGLSAEEEKSLKTAFEAQMKLNAEFQESRFPQLKKWFLEKSCQ